MRKPAFAEVMYGDFDGFFASCEQLKHPHLRNKPVGVIPMAKGSSCVIACSREAKVLGVKNVMPIGEVLRICPDIILWPQDPDLYRRAHNEMISEIGMVVPVDAVKSIDELCCVLDPVQQRNPQAVGEAIKARIAKICGPWISFSVGFGPNRLTAKMACKAGKPAGNMVWKPEELATHLTAQRLKDVPGIGERLLKKLYMARIWDMEGLLKCGPRHMRMLWHSVHGERMYYALHGFDIKAQPTARNMYGHSRILPPSHRSLALVRPITRMLAIKATRRMRRDDWRASQFMLGLQCIGLGLDRYWCRSLHMPGVADYQGVLAALESLWLIALRDIDPRLMVFRADVCLGELSPIATRQLDMWSDDEGLRLEQEAIAKAMDDLNHRYGATVLTQGMWTPPPGDHTGAKISYTRIPRREDFH